MRLTNTLRSSQVRLVLHADKLVIIKALFCYTLYFLKIVFISFSSAGLLCTLCAVSEFAVERHAVIFFWKKEYCDDEYRREGDLKKVNSTLTS